MMTSAIECDTLTAAAAKEPVHIPKAYALLAVGNGLERKKLPHLSAQGQMLPSERRTV
jgi:hypothetical protein